MHQDAYIFQRLNLSEIRLAEYLESEIWGCCDAPGSGKLDPAIKSTWQSTLEACYMEPYQTHPPIIDNWHGSFRPSGSSSIRRKKEAPCPPRTSRRRQYRAHVPGALNDLDNQYLKGLATPLGPLDYDEIFNRAMENVLGAWSHVADAVFRNDNTYLTASVNWNLDTGKDPDGNYVYWRESGPG